MALELELNSCPFCGQMCMTKPGTDIREACQCEAANRWRSSRDRKVRLCSAIDKLFGPGCAVYSPEFNPVSEEELADLHAIAEMVAFGRIGPVQTIARDGSKIQIGEKVRRTTAVKAEETK